MEKMNLKTLKYISICSVFFTIVGAVLAIERENTSPGSYNIPMTLTQMPEAVTQMAASNPYLAIVYIMGLITCFTLFFSWKQLEIIKKNSESFTRLNGDLNRVVDNLNTRPCIHNEECDRIQSFSNNRNNNNDN
jgi:hypothetical protein